MQKKYTYLIIVLLIISSCVAFGRIAYNGFINYDDSDYITENIHIQSGINAQSLKWAITAVVIGHWHPLTFVSHMLDWSLFGANASGHHLVSLFLHICTATILFLFLNKTTHNIWPSAFAAAFFALHPLRVESVAWAAERKDVLSVFFGMLCIYAYAFYSDKTKFPGYMLCLILFALALMSKPMLVTLPFLLMLLDYWPLQRWQKVFSEPVQYRISSASGLLWEKIPFFCLAIISSTITFFVQKKGGAVTSSDVLQFPTRLSNAVLSYATYLWKMLWPHNLSVFYPYELFMPLWKVLIAAFIMIAITVIVLYSIKELPFLFVGWLWYVGALLPVIGLIQSGEQAMADRYTYLPSIGISIIVAWGISHLIKNMNISKTILFTAAIFYLAFLLFLTWMQCGYWKNSIDLFSQSLQVTNNNYKAHTHIGVALLAAGKYEEAIAHFNIANRMSGNSKAYIYINRGNAYKRLGQYQLALEDHNSAIRLKPDFAITYLSRGAIYDQLNQYEFALKDYNDAIYFNPNYTDAYAYRAILYLNHGQKGRGCNDAQKACELGKCEILELAKSKKYCP